MSPRYLIISYATYFGVRLFFGVFLIVAGARIATTLFPQAREFSALFSIADLQALAFSTLGLYYLVKGLGGLGGAVSMLRQHQEWQSQTRSQYLWTERGEALVEAGILFVAGLLLFAGSRGISTIWKKPHPMDSAPEDESRESNGGDA